MSFWFLDKDPALATQALTDEHLRFALASTTQLLANAVHVLQSERIRWQAGNVKRLGVVRTERVPFIGTQRFWKTSYADSPLSDWARSTRDTFLWVQGFAEWAARERMMRLEKPHDHATLRLTRSCASDVPEGKLLAPPFSYGATTVEAAVQKHREQYMEERHVPRFGHWTNRRPPGWWAFEVTERECKHGKEYRSR